MNICLESLVDLWGLKCVQRQPHEKKSYDRGLIRRSGIQAPQFIPSPLNIFMNIPVHEDRNTLAFGEPTSKEGQYISLRAEMDLIIAFSN
jgi:uncharacterized protein YcgI (DUF1989 family)